MAMRTVEPLQPNRRNEVPRVFNPQYTLRDPVSTTMPLSPEAFYQRAEMLKSSFSKPGIAQSIGGLAFNTKVRDYHQEALGIDDTAWRNTLGAAGFAAGAYAGAKVGASLGTIAVPGLGNIIGAGVGALTGGLIGSAGAQIASPSGLRGTTATLRHILSGVPELDFRGLQFLGASLDQMDGAAIIKSGILSLQEKDRSFIESIKKAYAMGGEFEELYASDVRKNLGVDFGQVGNAIADFAGEALMSPGLWNAKIISGAKTAAQSKMIPTMLNVAKKSKFKTLNEMADPNHARRFGDIFLDATVNKSRAKTNFRDAVIKDDTFRKKIFDIASSSGADTTSRGRAFNDTVDELFEDMYTEFLKNESPESIGRVKRMMSGKEAMTDYLQRTDSVAYETLPDAIKKSLQTMDYNTANAGWDRVVKNYPNLKRWQTFDDAAARALWFQVSPPLSLLKNSRRLWRFSKRFRPFKEYLNLFNKNLEGTAFKKRLSELKTSSASASKSIDESVSEISDYKLKDLEERAAKASTYREINKISEEIDQLYRSLADAKEEADYFQSVLDDMKSELFDKLDMRFQDTRVGPEDKSTLVKRSREIDEQLKLATYSHKQRLELHKEKFDIESMLETISDIEHLGELDRESFKFLIEVSVKADQIDQIFRRDFDEFRLKHEARPGEKIQLSKHSTLSMSKREYENAIKRKNGLSNFIRSRKNRDVEIELRDVTRDKGGTAYVSYTMKDEKLWGDLSPYEKKQAFYSSEDSENVRQLENSTKEYLDAIRSYRTHRGVMFNGKRMNELIDNKFKSLENKDIVRLSPELRSTIHKSVLNMEDFSAYHRQLHTEMTEDYMRNLMVDEKGNLRPIGSSGNIVESPPPEVRGNIVDDEGNAQDIIDTFGDSTDYQYAPVDRLMRGERASYFYNFHEGTRIPGSGQRQFKTSPRMMAMDYGDELISIMRNRRYGVMEQIQNKIDMLETSGTRSQTLSDWKDIKHDLDIFRKDARYNNDDMISLIGDTLHRHRPDLFRAAEETPKQPVIQPSDVLRSMDTDEQVASVFTTLSHNFRKSFANLNRHRTHVSEGPATALHDEKVTDYIDLPKLGTSPGLQRRVSRLIKDPDIDWTEAIQDPDFIYGLYVTHSYIGAFDKTPWRLEYRKSIWNRMTREKSFGYNPLKMQNFDTTRKIWPKDSDFIETFDMTAARRLLSGNFGFRPDDLVNDLPGVHTPQISSDMKELPTIFDFEDYESLDHFLFEARQYIKGGITRDATGKLTHRSLYGADYFGAVYDFSEHSSKELEDYITEAFGKEALSGRTPDLLNFDKYDFKVSYPGNLEDLDNLYNEIYDTLGLEQAFRRLNEGKNRFQMPFQKNFHLNNHLFLNDVEVHPVRFVMDSDALSKEDKNEFLTLFNRWYKDNPDGYKDDVIKNFKKRKDVTRMLQIQDMAGSVYDRHQVNKDITTFEMIKTFNREDVDFEELIRTLDGRSEKGGISHIISSINADMGTRAANEEITDAPLSDLESVVSNLRGVNNLRSLFDNLFSDDYIRSLLNKRYPESHELGALMDFVKTAEFRGQRFFDLDDNGRLKMSLGEINHRIDTKAEEVELRAPIRDAVKDWVREAYNDVWEKGADSIYANSGMHGEVNSNTIRFLTDTFDSIGELMDDVSARNGDIIDKSPELMEAKSNLYLTSRTLRELLAEPLKRVKNQNRTLKNQLISSQKKHRSELFNETSSAIRARNASPITIKPREASRILSAEKRLMSFEQSNRNVSGEMLEILSRKSALEDMQKTLRRYAKTKVEKYYERFGSKNPVKSIKEDLLNRVDDMEKFTGRTPETQALRDGIERTIQQHRSDADMTALHIDLQNLVRAEVEKYPGYLSPSSEATTTVRSYSDVIRDEYRFGEQSERASELQGIFDEMGRDEDYMLDFLSSLRYITGNKRKMEAGYFYYLSQLKGKKFGSRDFKNLTKYMQKLRGKTYEREIIAAIGYSEMLRNGPLEMGFTDSIDFKWDIMAKRQNLKGIRKPPKSTEIVDTYLDINTPREDLEDIRLRMAKDLGYDINDLDTFNKHLDDEKIKEIQAIKELLDETDFEEFELNEFGAWESDAARRILRLFGENETIQKYPDAVMDKVEQLEESKAELLRGADHQDIKTWQEVEKIEKQIKDLKASGAEDVDIRQITTPGVIQLHYDRIKRLEEYQQKLRDDLDDQLDYIGHKYGGEAYTNTVKTSRKIIELFEDFEQVIRRSSDEAFLVVKGLQSKSTVLQNFSDMELRGMIRVFREAMDTEPPKSIVSMRGQDPILDHAYRDLNSLSSVNIQRDRSRVVDGLMKFRNTRNIIDPSHLLRSEKNIVESFKYSELKNFINKTMNEKYSYQDRFEKGLGSGEDLRDYRYKKLRSYETFDMTTIREVFQDADDFTRFLRDNPEYKLTTIVEESSLKKRVRDNSPFFRHTTEEGDQFLYKSNISHEALNEKGEVVRERPRPHVGEPYKMGQLEAQKRGDFDTTNVIKEVVVDDETSMRDLFNMGPDELGHISLMSHENFKRAKKLSYNKAKLPPVFDKFLRGFQRVIKQAMLLSTSWNPTNFIDVGVKNSHAMRGRWSAVDYVHYLGEANFYYSEWSKLKSRMMSEVHRLDSSIHDKLRDLDHFRSIRDSGTDPRAIENAKTQIHNIHSEIDGLKKQLRRIDDDEVTYFQKRLKGDFNLKTLEEGDPDTDTIAYGVYKHLRKRREFRRASADQKQKMLNEHYEDYVSMMKLVNEFEASSASTDIAAYMRNLSEETFSEFRGRTLYSKYMNWLADENPLVKANMTVATRIEQVGRLHGYMLDTFVFGKGHDEAIYRSLKRHYDYSERSMLEAWSNLVFPFIQFPTRNALYWAEELTYANNSRRMMNKLDALWGEYDLNENEYAQDARMRGYIPIGKERMLRISDSRLSAVRLFNNPGAEASSRLSPLIREPIEAISGNKSVANSAISAIPYVNRLPDAVRRIQERHTRPLEVSVAPRLVGQLYRRTGYNNHSNRYDVYKNLYDINGNYRYREGADPYYKIRSIMYRQRGRQWR